MAGDVVKVERSGERPGGASWLPVVGALTGALSRIRAVLLPAATTRPAETRGSGRRDEVMAQITFYGQHTRSGKVHVTRRTEEVSIIDTARREWLTRAILLNARLERERLRYAKSGGRPLETRQLEEAEARVSEHWANAATLVHPEGTES